MWWADMFLLFLIYSFLGWFYESIVVSIMEKRPVNRGFLNGPLCPVYGVGALLVAATLYGHIHNPAWLFLAGALLTCAVEYFTGWLLERFFKAKWWDYSNYRFNIKGRVSLQGALVFGALSVTLVLWVHPFFVALLTRVPTVARAAVALASAALMAADLTVTVVYLLRLNGRLEEIQLALNGFAEKYSARAAELRDAVWNRLEESTLPERAAGLRDAVFDRLEETGLPERAAGLRTAVLDRLEETGLPERAAELRAALLARFEESEFYSERIRGLLLTGRLQGRRIARAFPHLRPLHSDEAWRKLRSALLRGREPPQPLDGPRREGDD